jgi:hypothetical protein
MLQQTQVKPKVMMEIGSSEAVREAVARGIGTVSTAEFIPDPRIRMLPFSDVDVFNYAHVVCLEERKGERLIGAFLGGVTELLKRRGNGARPSRSSNPANMSVGARATCREERCTASGTRSLIQAIAQRKREGSEKALPGSC